MGLDIYLDLDPAYVGTACIDFAASGGRGLRDLLLSGDVHRIERQLGFDLSFLRYFDEDVNERELREDYELPPAEVRRLVAARREASERAWITPSEAARVLDSMLHWMSAHGNCVPVPLAQMLAAGDRERCYLSEGRFHEDLTAVRRAVERASAAGARRVRLAVW